MQLLTDKPLKFNTLSLFSLAIFAIALVAFTPAKKAISSLGSYDLVNTVPIRANYVTSDFLKQVYTITLDNQVMKYDSVGRLLTKYSAEKGNGQLTSIDATSPFNVLFFYQESSKIVTADMRLSKRRTYDLEKYDIYNVGAVCLSQDNYIWVYDLDANKLKKINHNNEVIYESMDLRRILGVEVVPSFMMEKSGMILMNIPNVGVMMFDSFGTYYSSLTDSEIGTSTLERFQIAGPNIVYYKDGRLHLCDVRTANKKEIVLPKSIDTQDVRIEKGHLFVLNKANLEFYQQVR